MEFAIRKVFLVIIVELFEQVLCVFAQCEKGTFAQCA
jgi:hypothetical protein